MSSDVDRSVRIGTIELASPILTASGTSGHGAELGAYFDLRDLGAVVVKSLSAEPWPGNPAPRVYPVPGGMLNSVGLQGPGIDAWLRDELPLLEESGATVVVSIWGRTVADFAQAAKMLSATSHAIVAVEVNISCPNVEDRSRMFAHSPRATRQVLEVTEVCGRPRWAKLSPNVADITEIATAAVDGGASALTLTNTLLGLAIDIERRRPVLGGIGGGLSGPALHTVTCRAIYDCYRARPDVPIIGVGGVARGEDAVELMMAGATAVGVGTATLADPRAPHRVLDELITWCKRHNVGSVATLTGGAHD